MFHSIQAPWLLGNTAVLGSESAATARSVKKLHRFKIETHKRMPASLNFSSENRSADLTGARPLIAILLKFF
jgi:hypothetical protein